MILEGDRNRIFENVLNTNDSCVRTDYSSDCANACSEPASCNSTTGGCTCPISTLNLVVSSDPTKETCRCPNHPFVYYNTTDCISVSGKTNFTHQIFNVLRNENTRANLDLTSSEI